MKKTTWTIFVSDENVDAPEAPRFWITRWISREKDSTPAPLTVGIERGHIVKLTYSDLDGEWNLDAAAADRGEPVIICPCTGGRSVEMTIKVVLINEKNQGNDITNYI